ncbi:MAG: DUF2344 domain-containing protein [Eggerthellaceae bacterium]|nr:DUF2344 domain-containing protein [Eggerthellaceae bacterium]
MTDPNLFRLRATFVEQGRLALLSHREMANTLERTVRRANLPYAVSQGFSPHMKLAFGAALPVGVGSTCEIFDLQLTRYVAPDKVLQALKAVSVPDLMVSECHYIDHKAPAASVAFPFSTYVARFSRAVGEDDVAAPETVVLKKAAKRGKPKEKVLVVKEFLAKPYVYDGDEVTFTLEAKPTGSLRPDVLVAESVKAFDVTCVFITRVAQSAALDTN